MAFNQPDSNYEEADDSPGFLLWRMYLDWQRKIKAALDPLDLTHTQFVLLVSLWWLTSHGEEVNQNRLAAHAHTDRMMTSKVIDTLCGKGLMKRTQHESDQRVRILSLTRSGSILLKKAIAAVENTDKTYFDKLGNRQKEFIKAMQILVQEVK